MSFDPQKVLQEQEMNATKRSQSSYFLTKIRDFQTAHNRLKHHVHTAWRYPLPPWGRAVMGCVYFSIPVVVGYYGVNYWVVKPAEATVDQRLGHFVRDKQQQQQQQQQHQGSSTMGNTKLVKDGLHVLHGETVRTEHVGAGGWGGGVHLANSDRETQDVNRVNLERFLRKQRRLKEKRERQETNSKKQQQQQQQLKETKETSSS